MTLEKIIDKILISNEGRYRQLFSDKTVNEILKKKDVIIDITLEDDKILRNIEDSIEESIRIYLLRKEYK